MKRIRLMLVLGVCLVMGVILVWGSTPHPINPEDCVGTECAYNEECGPGWLYDPTTGECVLDVEFSLTGGGSGSLLLLVGVGVFFLFLLRRR